MKRPPRILVINPGSTSTKLGYFEGEKPLEIHTADHLADPRWTRADEDERYHIRLEETLRFAEGKPADLIMARGGLLKPMPAGIYEINEKMLEDLRRSERRHASNSAAPIAYELARQRGVKAYIADPVTTDEMEPLARYSGHPEFPRISIFHALNQKAVARKYAASAGKAYEDLNLIVIHMGGGISVGAHKRGKVADVNQALDGDGPFSPERSGTLPAGDLVRAAFSGKYSREQLLRMITGEGGVKAYTGTADIKKLLDSPDPDTRRVIDAMIYQIAKEAAAAMIPLEGHADAIILTGGLARSPYITEGLKKRLAFLKIPVAVYPGENELEALAYNGVLVWEGLRKPKIYA
ncbi:MAG: butyrate kinase [Chlorobi bacterium]|nr:butyrate kinase [Chlorobiota bacterium]